MFVSQSIAILAVFASLTSAAAAKENSGSSANDPTAKVCQDIIPVGTRLVVKRVCTTRAQWEEKRRRDRELLEQAQKSPCVRGSIDRGQEVCF